MRGFKMDEETFSVPKGCGERMGDLKCGEITWEFNEHRMMLEITIHYCNKCRAKIRDKIRQWERKKKQE